MTTIELTDEELAELAKADIAIKLNKQTLKLATEVVSSAASNLRASVELSASIIKGALIDALPDPLVADPPVDIDDDIPVEEPVDDDVEYTAIDEGLPFKAGGKYAWLPDRYEFRDVPDWLHSLAGTDGATSPAASLAINVNDPRLSSVTSWPVFEHDNWESDQLYTLPPEASGRWDRCISHAQPWGEQGPLWYARNYEVEGTVGNCVVWRAGDFNKGREGHSRYYNVRGDLSIHDELHVQCGGQAIQLCWRTGKTKSDPSTWPENRAGSWIRLENIAAIDPGVINVGQSVRASWPFTIFNTGHAFVELDGIYLRCNHAQPFDNQQKTNRRSHGFLITAPGKREVRIGQVILNNIDVEITDSDRSMCRHENIGDVIYQSGRMAAHGKPANIAVVNDVERFYMDAFFGYNGNIDIYKKERKWSNPVHTIHRTTGQEIDIDPRDFS